MLTNSKERFRAGVFGSFVFLYQTKQIFARCFAAALLVLEIGMHAIASHRNAMQK